MKIKQKAADFRVLELPKEGFPSGDGEYLIYRVTKTKWTTLDVADRIADEAGVEKRSVAFAGLKDRQGITTQFFSVEGGRRLSLTEPGLRIECIGQSDVPVDSDCIVGNAFDITVRDLNPEDIRCYRSSKDVVRVQGVPNYFDDQRFGALRHGQGFIVKEMIAGDLESALKRILLYPSPFDPPREAAFKGRLRRAWGEFEECVKLCRGGKHISVFEHLAKHPKDFAGAFRFVSQRIRLIHLYSFQSYLWNLCVSEYLTGKVPIEHQVFLPTDMGPVLAYSRLDPPMDTYLLSRTFPLLAPDTKFTDIEMERAVDKVLEREDLTLDRLTIPGVEGFAFKTEERSILVTPRHWRAIRSEPDDDNPGSEKLRIRFELPRGSYATMIVKRLFASRVDRPQDPVEISKSGQPRYRKPLGMGIRESGNLPDSMRPKGEVDSQRREDARGGRRFGGRPGTGFGGARGARPTSRFGGPRPTSSFSGPRSSDSGPPGPRPPRRFDGPSDGRGGPRRGGPGGLRGGSRPGGPRFPRRGGPGGPRRGGPR